MWLFDVLVMNILVWNTHLDYNRRRKNPHILWNAVKATAARFDWLLGSLSDDSTVTLLSCDLCYMADSKPKAITPPPPPTTPTTPTPKKNQNKTQGSSFCREWLQSKQAEAAQNQRQQCEVIAARP